MEELRELKKYNCSFNIITVNNHLKCVLEKDGEDQLDRSYGKLRSVTWIERGEEYSAYNEKKEG